MQQIHLAQQQRAIPVGDGTPAPVDVQGPGLVEIVTVLQPLPVRDGAGFAQRRRNSGPGRVVREGGMLGQFVCDVDAEAVHPPVQPELNHLVEGGSHAGMGPVEIRLLGQMQVQVPLGGGGVEGPRRPAERAGPVVGRAAARRGIPPDVPVTQHAGSRRAGRAEPPMVRGGVVGDQVDKDAQAQPVRLGDHGVERCEVTEPRVDAAVVGNVVTMVGQRRAVERGQPHQLDPQPGEVGQVLTDSHQVTEPVAVTVGERGDIDLIASGLLPPRGARRGQEHDVHPSGVTCQAVRNLTAGLSARGPAGRGAMSRLLPIVSLGGGRVPRLVRRRPRRGRPASLASRVTGRLGGSRRKSTAGPRGQGRCSAGRSRRR
jgi:hypothetical protein